MNKKSFLEMYVDKLHTHLSNAKLLGFDEINPLAPIMTNAEATACWNKKIYGASESQLEKHWLVGGEETNPDFFSGEAEWFIILAARALGIEPRMHFYSRNLGGYSNVLALKLLLPLTDFDPHAEYSYLAPELPEPIDYQMEKLLKGLKNHDGTKASAVTVKPTPTSIPIPVSKNARVAVICFGDAETMSGEALQNGTSGLIQRKDNVKRNFHVSSYELISLTINSEAPNIQDAARDMFETIREVANRSDVVIVLGMLTPTGIDQMDIDLLFKKVATLPVVTGCYHVPIKKYSRYEIQFVNEKASLALEFLMPQYASTSEYTGLQELSPRQQVAANYCIAKDLEDIINKKLK